MKGYNKLRQKAITLLSTRLSKKLTYHGLHHTLDVLRVCNSYIRRLNIPTEKAKLLRIAALYHDIGFTNTYKNHEMEGVRILKSHMEEIGCDMRNFNKLEGMIMSTKIPQSPSNILEEIICDADLDYLGKDQYYEISRTLFIEMKNYNLISGENEWNKIQVSFLNSHQYHTQFAQKNLEPGKQKRIAEIQELIS